MSVNVTQHKLRHSDTNHSQHHTAGQTCTQVVEWLSQGRDSPTTH
jgi:hypothetical protein